MIFLLPQLVLSTYTGNHNQTTKMNAKTCITCFEDVEYFGFTCNTCVDGKMCWDCFDKLAMNGNCSTGLIYKPIKYIKKKMVCPCCRTINWKQLYNRIVNYDLFDVKLGYSCDEDWYINKKPNKALLDRKSVV